MRRLSSSRVLSFTLAFAASFTAACDPEPEEDGPCEEDADCAGDEKCSDGTCEEMDDEARAAVIEFCEADPGCAGTPADDCAEQADRDPYACIIDLCARSAAALMNCRLAEGECEEGNFEYPLCPEQSAALDACANDRC